MYQSTEATYMDDKGKALGYAYGNSDTYTDPVTQKTVTNSNLSFRVLKGATWQRSHGWYGRDKEGY